jgi:protein-disulfide isomerase
MLRTRFIALAALLLIALSPRVNAGNYTESNWKALLMPPPSGDHVLGKADAPVTIIEYASLTCPHCAEFHEKALPAIQKAYIDTGKAKLIFRGLTLNPLDTTAQMLTRCIADDKYFPFVSALFVTQKSWAVANDSTGALLQVSKQAGFTKDSFEKCLRNQKALDEINATRKVFEEKVGRAMTPTFIVNGKLLPPQASLEAQQSELEKLILSQLKS